MPFCVDCGKKTQEGQRCSYCSVSERLSSEENPKPKKVLGLIVNFIIFIAVSFTIASFLFRSYAAVSEEIVASTPQTKGNLRVIRYDDKYEPYADAADYMKEVRCTGIYMALLGAAIKSVPGKYWNYDYSDEDMNSRRVCLIAAACNRIDGKNNIFDQMEKQDGAGKGSVSECIAALRDQAEIENSFPEFVADMDRGIQKDYENQ